MPEAKEGFGSLEGLRPIGAGGYVCFDDIGAEDDSGADGDSVWAVLIDDRIVEIVAALRMSVGCPVAGAKTSKTIYWDSERQGPPGLYAFLSSIPEEAAEVIEERKVAGKPFKQFSEMCSNLRSQIFFEVVEDDDTELFDEIMEEGLGAWLRQVK